MRYIYNKHGDTMYCIRDDGKITDKHDCDVVAHFKENCIKDKFNIDTLYKIRPDGTITDKWDSDIVGHITEDGLIMDKFQTSRLGYIRSRSSSGETEIFDVILAILAFVFMLIFKAVRFLAVYFFAPLLSGRTWLFIIYVAFAAIGILPLTIALAIVTEIILVSFYPYWGLLIAKKVKKEIDLKEMLRFYRLWFIKGPFAYKELLKKD